LASTPSCQVRPRIVCGCSHGFIRTLFRELNYEEDVVISDNVWQSAFLVTDEGVIVFDAPESFGKSILSAIAKVTDKPIKMLN
jgi:hypothetical protein